MVIIAVLIIVLLLAFLPPPAPILLVLSQMRFSEVRRGRGARCQVVQYVSVLLSRL